MQKLTLVVLALLAISAVNAQFTGGSDFCTDEKSLETNVDVLLEGGESSSESSNEGGSGSGSGLEEGSTVAGDIPGKYCLLLKYLYGLAIQFEGTAVYELWLEFIEELHYQIVLDVTLTTQEKIQSIWARLDAFIAVHVEIQEAVYYLYISEWGGYVRNLEAVSVSFSAQISESIIVLESSGSTELFDALRNGTSGELATLVETLIQEITAILQGGYSYSYELVLIYEKIEAFLEENSQYSEELLSVEIEGYGVFGAFYQVTAYYWRAYNFQIAIGGEASSTGLIEVLTAAYQNTSTGSVSQRSQIKQLVEKLTAYFESNTDVSVRIQYVYEQLYQFLILQQWSVNVLYSLQIQGYGDIYELIYAFVLEQNLEIDFSNPVVSTSTAAGADCSDVLQINAFSSNTSDLLTSIDVAQESWNATEITRFSAYKKRIYVVTSNSTATLQEKYSAITTVVNAWTTNTFYLNLVKSIQIIQWGGTVSEAISCNA
uniref:PKD domain-containing protein n=2 Tax=Bursaphelenchus xylophilus TaxID=6326 RepID=A0A1I7RJ48_BURXY